MMQMQNPLDQIYSEAQQCQKCFTIPPLETYKCYGVKFPVAYYSKEEGGINAKIVFIMESPGIAKGGAAQTGNLESGGNYDATARNGAALRKHAGINPKDCFVTNSILHAGMTNEGKMRGPKNNEIKTCSSFVKRIIDVINLPLVVAVGNAALRSFPLSFYFLASTYPTLPTSPSTTLKPKSVSALKEAALKQSSARSIKQKQKSLFRLIPSLLPPLQRPSSMPINEE